jgi:hypothetical protein
MAEKTTGLSTASKCTKQVSSTNFLTEPYIELVLINLLDFKAFSLLFNVGDSARTCL